MSTVIFKTIIIGCVILCINGISLPWSWDTVPLWADFQSYTSPIFTDYQLEFAANTYDIISIEKCLGQYWNGDQTESAFYETASKIRLYSPSSDDTKILFYWHAEICYCECYNVTQTVAQNSSMWFYDDNNDLKYASLEHRPYYDVTQEYVRNWWVHSLVSIIKGALDQNIQIDGVFVDGLCSWFGSTVSDERRAEYDNGIRIMLNKTRQEFNKIDPNLFILGNGLIGYTFIDPNYCLDTVPYVDGLCIEHFGSFEQVNDNTGTLKPDYLLTWYNVTQSVMNGDYGANKSIFIKAWPGPIVQPIDGMGPSWPSIYGSRPSTNEGIANAAAQLLMFPLATYLCGIYQQNVYFAYSWWYGITQGWVPCPDDPSSCTAPLDWYPEFENQLGQPLGDGIMTDTYKCNRSFEYANVYVDLEDYSSAIIEWLTDSPTEQPTTAPTKIPTEPTKAPTIQPTKAPTIQPTKAPTDEQTVSPTHQPTKLQTNNVVNLGTLNFNHSIGLLLFYLCLFVFYDTSQ